MSFASKSAGEVDVRADPLAEDRVERQVVGQQADRPGPHRLVLVVEQAAEERRVGPADHVQRPERPELAHGVGLLVEEVAEGLPGVVQRLAAGRAVGQHAPGLADEPFVRMAVQGDQLALVELRQVADRRSRRARRR